MRLIRGNYDREVLFERLVQIAKQLPDEPDYNCSIQGTGQQLLVTVSEPKSAATVWEWAGSPEVIVAEFRRWIARRKPN